MKHSYLCFVSTLNFGRALTNLITRLSANAAGPYPRLKTWMGNITDAHCGVPNILVVFYTGVRE